MTNPQVTDQLERDAACRAVAELKATSRALRVGEAARYIGLDSRAEANPYLRIKQRTRNPNCIGLGKHLGALPMPRPCGGIAVNCKTASPGATPTTFPCDQM